MRESDTSIPVWDPLVRIFHWSLAACFTLAYLTEDEWLDLHQAAGYSILGLVLFRLVWGLIGSRHARFSDFVVGPGAVLGYLRSILARKPRRYIGHNPAGGMMVLALLLALTLTAVSGLLLLGSVEQAGPLAGLLPVAGPMLADILEEVHELAANLTLTLVALHLAGVLLAMIQHRENLIRAMFSGRKPARPQH